MLGAEQTNSTQIQRLLWIGKTRREFIEPGRQELRACLLSVGVGEFTHKKKEQLWILWRCNAIYRFQVFKFRTGRYLSIFRAIVV